MADTGSLPVIYQLHELDTPVSKSTKPHSKVRSSSQKGVDTLNAAVHCLKNVDALYYNSLVDKNNKPYLRKPSVKKYLYDGGFIAEDGTVYPTRQEQVEVNRASRKMLMKQEIKQQLAKKYQARLLGLRQQARANEVIFTRSGVYVSGDCDEYRKQVMLSLKHQRPSSRLYKQHLPSMSDMTNASTQTSTVHCHPIFTQTSLRNSDCHISTQTSLKKSGCHIYTQTSEEHKDKKNWASVEMHTQTSGKQMFNTATQTSYITECEMENPKLSSDASVSGHNMPCTESSNEDMSPQSSQTTSISRQRSESVAYSSSESENFNFEMETNLKSEEEALEKELQRAKQFYKASRQTLYEMHFEMKLQHLHDEKNHERLMLALAETIRRKTALTVIKNTMEEQCKIILSDMERIARQEEEDQKMQELLTYSFQVKKQRTPTELVHLLPGQSDHVQEHFSTGSMPPRLSSFHCQQILENLAQRNKMLRSPPTSRRSLNAPSCSSFDERTEFSSTMSSSSASLATASSQNSLVFREDLSKDLTKCAAIVKRIMECLSPRSSSFGESSDVFDTVNERLLEVFSSRSNSLTAHSGRKTSTKSSSRCSTIKLPQVDTSTPVNLTKASIEPEQNGYNQISSPIEKDVSPLSECSDRVNSVTALGKLSERWSAMRKNEVANAVPTSTLTLGSLSDDWSSDEVSDIDSPSIKLESYGINDASSTECPSVSSEHYSINRPPTPPMYSTPLTKVVSRSTSSNSSLKTIKEGVLADFSKEFSTPIMLSSLHALDSSMEILIDKTVAPADTDRREITY